MSFVPTFQGKLDSVARRKVLNRDVKFKICSATIVFVTSLHSKVPVPVIMAIDKSALLIEIVATFHISLRNELVSLEEKLGKIKYYILVYCYQPEVIVETTGWVLLESWNTGESY